MLYRLLRAFEWGLVVGVTAILSVGWLALAFYNPPFEADSNAFASHALHKMTMASPWCLSAAALAGAIANTSVVGAGRRLRTWPSIVLGFRITLLLATIGFTLASFMRDDDLGMGIGLGPGGAAIFLGGYAAQTRYSPAAWLWLPVAMLGTLTFWSVVVHALRIIIERRRLTPSPGWQPNTRESVEPYAAPAGTRDARG